MRRQGEKHPLRLLVLITQLGITMMVPIFFCAWLGSLVSRKTGVELLFVLFLVMGALAGFRSCYHIIRRFVPLDSKKPGDTVPSSPESGGEDSLPGADYPGERPEDPWDR